MNLKFLTIMSVVVLGLCGIAGIVAISDNSDAVSIDHSHDYSIGSLTVDAGATFTISGSYSGMDSSVGVVNYATNYSWATVSHGIYGEPTTSGGVSVTGTAPSMAGTYTIQWNQVYDEGGFSGVHYVDPTFCVGSATLIVSPALGSFTVSYNANGGTGTIVSSTGVIEGSYVALKTNAFTYTGYTFIGWKVNNTGSTLVAGSSYSPTANVVMYAQWSANVYGITFNSNGGSDIASQSVNYGDYVNYPTSPTKLNYTFGGWYLNSALTDSFSFSTQITGNTTLYAKWILNSYSIAFDSNGGSSVSTLVIQAGDSASKPINPVKANSTFMGWYSDSALTTSYVWGSAVSSDITLYAKWNANLVVTFNTNGGSSIDSQGVSYGGLVVCPSDPTLSGYVFIGWYSDSGLNTIFSYSTLIVENTTIYAKFVEDSTYASSYPNITLSVDGSGTMTAVLDCDITNCASLSWDFGDGFTSSEQSVSHKYTSEQVYSITLTAVSEGGLSSSKTVTFSAEQPDNESSDNTMVYFGIGLVVVFIIGLMAVSKKH